MIVLLFTGGTIGMRHDPTAGGAVPSLRGRDILDLAPGIDRLASLEIDDWGAYPGPHMTIERMWALRARILEHLARAEVDGVVVTHGTDAVEETAYLIARSIWSEKPVVFTGAMRTSSDLSWDGPANLTGAVRVAASPDAHGRGALHVMADRILTALDVTKFDTAKLDAFESPVVGPLGSIDDGAVLFRAAPLAFAPPLQPDTPAEPVDIILAFAGADSRLLDASREQGRAVVVAAMGRGNVPPAMVDGIDRWIADEKPVVIVTRALRGRVGPTYGYPGGGRRLAERGAILAGSRRPQQARIDLMLALGMGLPVSGVRALLEGG